MWQLIITRGQKGRIIWEKIRETQRLLTLVVVLFREYVAGHTLCWWNWVEYLELSPLVSVCLVLTIAVELRGLNYRYPSIGSYYGPGEWVLSDLAKALSTGGCSYVEAIAVSGMTLTHPKVINMAMWRHLETSYTLRRFRHEYGSCRGEICQHRGLGAV